MWGTHEKVLEHTSRFGLTKQLRDPHVRGLEHHVRAVRMFREERMGDGHVDRVLQSRERLVLFSSQLAIHKVHVQDPTSSP